MLTDQFHYIDNEALGPEGVMRKEFSKKEILTLFVDPEKIESVRHKIARIMKQEEFRKKNQDLFESLTTREREILLLLAIGFNNPKIAEKLFISRQTVEQHRKNINRKLEVRSTADVTSYALAFNLI